LIGNTIQKKGWGGSAVFGGIADYRIPFSTINADASLNYVLRVFEKVNTLREKGAENGEH